MATVSDYFTFQNGYAFKSKDFTDDGEYKIVKIKELKDGSVKFFDDTAEINPSTDFDIEKYIIRKGDVLFALTGDPVSKPNPLSWVGRVSYYNYDEPALLNQRVCKAIPKSKVPSEYLYYFFRQNSEFYNLASKATGSASQANISTKTIEQHILEIPDADTIKKIVELMKNIDDKIQNNNQINRNLSEQAQLIFDEQYGKYPVISIDSDKTDIPTGWDYFRLEDLCLHVKPGTNYQPKRVEEGIPFLNVKCINGGYIDTSDAKLITEGEYERVHKTWKPEENDLLISRIGTLGLVAVIRKEDLPIAVHYNFINIKAKLLPFEFMYFLLNSKSFQRAYHLIKKNSVQEYVTIDEVADLKIPLPVDLSNVDFSQYVSLYEMILTIQRENKRLTELRDSLLPKLMSGELDVSELDI